MMTHTLKSCSAFNPSIYAAASGSSRGFSALLKGLTSVVVLKVERALYIHSPDLQFLQDLKLELATFGLRVWLSNH